MSIASELIDDEHPPPPAILLPTDFDQKTFWKVKPSRSFLPFRLNLPLNVGPGPFQSVRARIRYIIHGYEILALCFIYFPSHLKKKKKRPSKNKQNKAGVEFIILGP